MATDIIGDLFAPTEYPEGWTIEDAPPEAEQIPGWHVNVTPDVMDARPELSPFVVTPEPFRRVWSGDNPDAPILTIALRFEDEASGLLYFPEGAAS